MDTSWHEQRRTGLGGSDMPSILGVCPFGGTPLGVWRSKVGLTQPKDDDAADLQRGRFFEPIVRRLYEEDTGYNVVVREGLHRHDVETWAIGNLDGTICGEDGNGVLEIKVPRLRGFVKLEEEGIPVNYQVQVQHYLGVTGLLWADFVAWNPEAFRMIKVRLERDQDLIDLMWNKGREFWERHVLTGIPPDGKTPTALNLENLSPTVLRLDDDEWTEAASQWSMAKSIQQEADKFVEESREKLIGIACKHSSAKIRGGGISFSVGKDGRITIRDGRKEVL